MSISRALSAESWSGHISQKVAPSVSTTSPLWSCKCFISSAYLPFCPYSSSYFNKGALI